MRNRAKFRADRSNRCRDIAIIGLFRMAAAAVFDFKKSEQSRGSNCVTVPNFDEIAETAAEIWRTRLLPTTKTL